MPPVRFALQTAAVLTLVVLVSWPDIGPSSGSRSVWRTDGPLAGVAAADPQISAALRGQRRRAEPGYGSAGLDTVSLGGSANALQRKLSEFDIEGRRTPDAVRSLGGRINAVIGRARTALNAAVPFARVNLRSVITGLVEAHAIANEKGEFIFLDVTPSGYVVELIGPDSSVLATSEPLNVDLAELRQTTVRLAGPGAMLAAFGTLAPTASEPVQVAIHEGVNAVAQPANTVSPER